MDHGSEPNPDETTTLMSIPRTTLPLTLVLIQHLCPKSGRVWVSVVLRVVIRVDVRLRVREGEVRVREDEVKVRIGVGG